jgi:exopolysaccharide biosynthesis polyprenyl glycosylphosphotransferase
LRLQLGLALMGLDGLCIMAGFLAANVVYQGDLPFRVVHLTSALIAIFFLAAFGGRAYAIDGMMNRSAGLLRTLRAFLYAAGIMIFAAFYTKSSADLSRAGFALGSGFSVLFLIAGRRLFLQRVRKTIGNPYKVVVITDSDMVRAEDSHEGLLGLSFDVDDLSPQMYDRLGRAIEDADRLVIDCPPERRPVWIEALRGANIDAAIVVRELEALNPVELRRHNGLPTIMVARGPLNIQDRIVKRAFDVVTAAAALVLLSPMLLAVALAIRLESAGEVIFRQTRIGRGNKLFDIYKFRSMRVERCDVDGHASTARDDDRITRVGAFIRKTSIDELPQLLNVLRGEMSIVGPRPHALGSRAESQLFWEIDQRYWNRHAVKPGLTGLAQVRGFRGATSHRDDLIGRLHSDLEYLNNWSIWRDLGIIASTFRVLSHKNAF